MVKKHRLYRIPRDLEDRATVFWSHVLREGPVGMIKVFGTHNLGVKTPVWAVLLHFVPETIPKIYLLSENFGI